MSASIWKTADGSWVGEFGHKRDLYALKVVRHVQASDGWDDIAQAYLRDSAEKTRIAIAERDTKAPWPSGRDNCPALYVLTVPGSPYCQANTASSLPLNWDKYAKVAPPPVGTVVEYDFGTGPKVWRVVDSATWPLERIDDRGNLARPADWSRVTVVPVPEGWEPCTKEEACGGFGSSSTMSRPKANGPTEEFGVRWRFIEACNYSDWWDHIPLRRKPAEQQFNMTDAQRMLMDAPVKPIPSPGRGHLVPAAEQPAPVDVPVGSRWRNNDTGRECRVTWTGSNGQVRFAGEANGAGLISGFVRIFTRLPDPAPEQFVPRVAKCEDIKVGAVVQYGRDGTSKREVRGADEKGFDAINIEDGRTCGGAMTSVLCGNWTLIRPAPEAQAKLVPQALRPGDVVDIGEELCVVSRVTESGGVIWRNPMRKGAAAGDIAVHRHFIIAKTAHVGGIPIAEWVATVQPGRLAEGYEHERFKRIDKYVREQVGYVTDAGIPRDERPTCAACSRPITGRPLELDEGEVTLCPGDACVNAYAQMHAPKRYDPSEHMEACRATTETAPYYGLTEDMMSANYDEAGEARDWYAAAIDAHEANRYRREVGMCGPFVKGGKL